MPEENHAKTNNSEESHPDEEASQAGLWRIAAIAAVLAVTIVGVAFLWIKEPDRVAFITVNLLSLSVLIAITVQAYIYKKQWDAMQGQLKAMEDGLTETRKMVGHNERAVRAAEQNVELARQSAAQTESAMLQQQNAVNAQLDMMKEQTEAARISAKAAEESVKATQEAFRVGEAPYFGITIIYFTDFVVGRKVGLNIGFLNGGRTPAWQFYAMPVLIMGLRPEGERYWHFTPKSVDVAATFIPAGKHQGFEYESEFVFTEEISEALKNRRTRLFVSVTAHYKDIRRVNHSRTFRCVWHPPTGNFSDYDATA
jgi:hypothetical protein